MTRHTGNIFLTNIHRVYSGEKIPPSPKDENTMDYFPGKRPSGATTDSKVDLGMIVRYTVHHNPSQSAAIKKSPAVLTRRRLDCRCYPL